MSLNPRSISVVMLVLVAGCSREAPRSPDAGKLALDPQQRELPSDQLLYAALETVLARSPEELRTHVDPDLENSVMLLDSARFGSEMPADASPVGRVFHVKGRLGQLGPRRDGTEIPPALDEIWDGFIIDERAQQPYYFVYAGVPDASLYQSRVVLTGIYIEIREYVSKADIPRQAPTLVTRDLRRMVVR